MSLPIHVGAHSGYKVNERPCDFTVDEELYEIAEVEDRWYEPEAMYFRVRTTERKRYILRYDESEDEWTLQSGFDGDVTGQAEPMLRREIFLLPIHQTPVSRVDSFNMRFAEQRRGLRRNHGIFCEAVYDLTNIETSSG